MDAFWIILSGSLIAVPCALLGCFLVLRKMSMLGDAISHAVLPGIVIAYLFSGTRDNITMLIGATLTGILTTFLIEFLHRKANLQEDASIGVIFTALFAVGVILISVYTGNVDLDQDCVLYGEIAYVPLDTVEIFGLEFPKAFQLGVILLIFTILFINLFYKELKITTFDPYFASALGISVSFWHYLLMTMVSFTTVSAFESVGAILVVAFMIVPAATAYLITNSLTKMLFGAGSFAILAAIGGYYLAAFLDASISGAMSVVAGLIFMVTFIIVKFYPLKSQ